MQDTGTSRLRPPHCLSFLLTLSFSLPLSLLLPTHSHSPPPPLFLLPACSVGPFGPQGSTSTLITLSHARTYARHTRLPCTRLRATGLTQSRHSPKPGLPRKMVTHDESAAVSDRRGGRGLREERGGLRYERATEGRGADARGAGGWQRAGLPRIQTMKSWSETLCQQL